jgi:hypothetical protein
MNDATAMSPQLDPSFTEEWGRRFGEAYSPPRAWCRLNAVPLPTTRRTP